MKRYYFYIFLSILLFIPGTMYAYTEEECIGCHTGKSQESILRISVDEFRNSIHGNELTCQDCHSLIEGKEHEILKGSGMVDCGQCHEQENGHGLNAKKTERPQCYSCHGKHDILDSDEIVAEDHREEFKKSCKECHPLEYSDTGYFSWFASIRLKSHKKQDFSMSYDRTNCVGCHQGKAVHGENETVDEQNCNICHMDMKGSQSITGYIHPRADLKKQPVTFVAAVIYQVFILFILVGIFKFVILKFSDKSKK